MKTSDTNLKVQETLIRLGDQPLANGFKTNRGDLTPKFKLSYGVDEETGLLTQIRTPSIENMFNDSYPYVSSGSKVMVEHFKKAAEYCSATLGKEKKNILEIGSNDGVFVKNFSTDEAVCVEPCGNFAKITSDLGYKTYNKFWNIETATELLEEHGKFNYIYSANCMCHIPDIVQAFAAVSICLKKGGVFVFEDPSVLSMINNNSFDQLYDEHVHMFSPSAVANLLDKVGLTIYMVKHFKDIHGGSNRYYVIHKDTMFALDRSVNKALEDEEQVFRHGIKKTYREFNTNISKNAELLKTLITSLSRTRGQIVIGYGATSKLTTILNYCEITSPQDIKYVLDTTPEKIGKLYPGTNIHIKKYQEDSLKDVGYALLGAWNFKDHILEKESKAPTSFITHVPYVTIL